MPSSVQLEWRRLPGHTELKGRAGHSATLVGRRIFVLGGRHGNECFNDLWVFDINLEIWQQLQSAPFCPRAYHTATLVAGTELWVIGGNDLKNMLGDVHVLNTVTLKWTIPATKGPIANKLRGTHAAILHPVLSKAILVFGGYGGVNATWLSDLSILHTDTLDWEELTPTGKAPGGTGYHSLTAFGGTQVVLFGGKGASGLVSTDILSVYDAVENKWTSRKPRGAPPLPRASHKAALVGSNQIVIHGGRNAAKRLFDTCVLQAQLSRTSWSYRWHLLGPHKRNIRKSVGERLVAAANLERPQTSEVPEGRAAHSLLSRDRNLFIFGGYGGNGKFFSDIYVMQGLPESPAPGDKRACRSGKTPAMASKFRRLLEGHEADPEVGTGGWRSTKQRRLMQMNQGHQPTEQVESSLNLTHLLMDQEGCGQVRVGNCQVTEEGAALAASRRNEDRLNTSLVDNHHQQIGTSVVMLQALEAEKQILQHDIQMKDQRILFLESEVSDLRRDVQMKDQKIVSSERELANLRLTTGQRIQDFESEIESLHTMLRAGEKRSEALESENGRLKENVQAHVEVVQNKEREIFEAITKLRASEERAATIQKSLEEVTKTNSIMIKEHDEHRLNVQRLELELHKGAETYQQTCILHEKEKALLLNEVAERRTTAELLFTELGAVKESARSLQDTVDLLAKQLEREGSKVDTLQKEADELRRSNAALSGECRQLTAAKDGAKEAAEVLQADLQAAQALNQKNECEVSKLQDTLQKSKEHISALHASKRKDDETMEALQKDNEQLRDLIQEIEGLEQGLARSAQTILEKLRCARHFCTG